MAAALVHACLTALKARAFAPLKFLKSELLTASFFLSLPPQLPYCNGTFYLNISRGFLCGLLEGFRGLLRA